MLEQETAQSIWERSLIAVVRRELEQLQYLDSDISDDTGDSDVYAVVTHNLNANLVHKWIRVHAQKNMALQTAFIPVKALSSAAAPQVLPSTIRIEAPHSKGVVVVSLAGGHKIRGFQAIFGE